MRDLFNTMLNSLWVVRGLRVAFLVVICIPALHIAVNLLGKMLKRQITPQMSMVIRKILFYTGIFIILIMVFKELGFSLTAVLGTAGVMGVAIGFASQTSLSNIISGLFLIGEKPFQIGDLVRVGDKLGIIANIDLLSVKMRTLDNLYVRIPNESLIKQDVTNITRYPIRRMDLNIGVSYNDDVGKVFEVLKDIAKNNPHCLDEPEPLLLFKEFADSSQNIVFGVWFVKTDFLLLKNSIMQEIKKRFDEEGIEIPFPHRTFYVGNHTKAMPIDLPESASRNDNSNEG